MTYPTPQQPQQPPANWKHLPLWIGVGSFAVLCIGGIVYFAVGLSGGMDCFPAEATTVGIGQTACDGQFEFTVTKVECGKTTALPDFGDKPRGQFCVVTVEIMNIGNEPRTFVAGSQKAYSDGGVGYEASYASIGEIDTVDIANIKPGNSVTGQVVFDIPTTARIERLELHDDMAFSGGVTVTVAQP